MFISFSHKNILRALPLFKKKAHLQRLTPQSLSAMCNVLSKKIQKRREGKIEITK